MASTAIGDLLGLVRKHLYVPDGKPPEGWTIARCGSVLKRLLSSGYTRDELAAGIEGVALIRDAGELTWCPRGTKLTMRAIYNVRHGARTLLGTAIDRTYKQPTSRPPARRTATEDAARSAAPVRVSDVLDRLVPKKP